MCIGVHHESRCNKNEHFSCSFSAFSGRIHLEIVIHRIISFGSRARLCALSLATESATIPEYAGRGMRAVPAPAQGPAAVEAALRAAGGARADWDALLAREWLALADLPGLIPPGHKG